MNNLNDLFCIIRHKIVRHTGNLKFKGVPHETATFYDFYNTFTDCIILYFL